MGPRLGMSWQSRHPDDDKTFQLGLFVEWAAGSVQHRAVTWFDQSGEPREDGSTMYLQLS